MKKKIADETLNECTETQSYRNMMWSCLDFFSSHYLHFTLLSYSEGVNQNFAPRDNCHFEAVSILFDLRDTLDVFTFLDKVIRKT